MFYLTLDLELYHPIKRLNKKAKEEFILEQEMILKKIFCLFNENNVRISCFVTNEFAEIFYDFFHRYIVEKHEIGCHTDSHLFYNEENLVEFVNSIKKNKIFLERETGLKVQGFRAPDGVVPNNLAKILKELDFRYDSSVIPGFMPGRFNHSKSPKKPYFPDFGNIFISNKENRELIEFPLLTSKITKLSTNGIFFWYYGKFIDLKKYENEYAVIYLHSSDFKKFDFFEELYIWDKIKYTKSYWRFIEDYVNIYKNTDARLTVLYNNEIKKLFKN